MRKLLRCCWLLLLIPCNAIADELHTLKLNADFQIARESVREAIEGAGLVVTAVIPLNQMLERTAGDLGKGKSPFVELETIQFCSARLAWELAEENPAQVAFCPMSLTVFSEHGVPGSVISWRSPGRDSPARIRGDDLLRELATESRLLAD